MKFAEPDEAQCPTPLAAAGLSLLNWSSTWLRSRPGVMRDDGALPVLWLAARDGASARVQAHGLRHTREVLQLNFVLT